jgi:hypothetical protein
VIRGLILDDIDSSRVLALGAVKAVSTDNIGETYYEIKEKMGSSTEVTIMDFEGKDVTKDFDKKTKDEG